MEKMFTLLAQKSEVKDVKNALKKFNIKKKDIDISKVFNVQGMKLVYFAIVTDEETFVNITEAINGTRIY